MPLIVRPTKSAGTTQYQSEVGAGAYDILDIEIDEDLNRLYNLVNGQLENVNLSANAAIDYAKLNLTGRIRDADIALDANISGAKIAVGTIPGDRLIPGQAAITSLSQLGVGVTTAAQVHSTAQFDLNTGALDTDERLMRELTWTSRGGPVFVLGHVSGRLASLGASLPINVILRLDGAAGVPTDGLPIASQRQELAAAAVAPMGVTVQFLGLVGAGSHRIKLTAILQTANGTGHCFSAALSILEPA